jgi:hypothetical protein
MLRKSILVLATAAAVSAAAAHSSSARGAAANSGHRDFGGGGYMRGGAFGSGHHMGGGHRAAPLMTAMARDSQGTSWRLAERAYACSAPRARGSYGQSCHRNGAGELRGSGGRDVWGHWGAYYGPMIHFP